jgi:plastocyanin
MRWIDLVESQRVKCARAARLWALAPVLMLAFAAGCSGGAQHKPTRHVVEMRNFGFEPAEVHVAVGDTVVWMNRDVVPHTATAGAKWDTGNVEANGSGMIVVKSPGVQTYLCVYHPSMKGSVVAE